MGPRDRPHVRIFGPLLVEADGRRLGPRDLGGGKPRQVLEILAAHKGESVAKERLADLLWGEEHQPRDPMRALEAYVSVLRACLRRVTDVTVVASVPAAYRLETTQVDLDILSFDDLSLSSHVAEPTERVSLRERALALVRGPLLDDAPYAEWALPLRDLYAERHERLLLDLAEDYLDAGRPDVAVGHARSVLELHPTRERAYRLLIAAHYLDGNQDQALATYRQCVRVLDEELGVRPLPETEQAYLAVLRQDSRLLQTTRIQPVTLLAERPPPTRFARCGDATIAYQVLGDGALDVVFAHAWFSHMEVGWEEPRYAAFLHRLATGRRLIVFDRRGMGMSDPAPATVSLATRTADVLGVMDAAGSGQAVVMGSCGSGPVAISLAATAPERAAGLILFGTFPRMLACAGYPAGWSREFFEDYKAGIEAGWSTGRGIARSVPSAGPDDQLREWLGRLLRLSASPATARAILDFGATLDVREELASIRCPSLVLHRRDDQWVRPENGRYLADHILGATYLELDGNDHWPWFGDAESVLAPVEQFLGDLARGLSEGRRAP